MRKSVAHNVAIKKYSTQNSLRFMTDSSDLIADAANGLDQIAAGAKFLPEGTDVNIDGAVFAVE